VTGSLERKSLEGIWIEAGVDRSEFKLCMRVWSTVFPSRRRLPIGPLVCLVVGAGSQERSAAVSCVTCDNTRHDAGSRGSRVSPFGHFCARSGYAREFLNPDRANLDYASV
jgi:hypothetical protein